jgi:hypothetical protein
MDLTRLLIGLFLPWIVGFIWLRAAENRLRHNGQANTLRQLGYGLFLGYACVQGLVLLSAALLGRVNFWAISGVIVLLIIPGIWLNRTSINKPPKTAKDAQAWETMPLPSKLLAFTVLVLIFMHLWLSALEIFNRPVYPWDAWLAWLYRAKAWYFSGAVYQLAPASEWLRDVAISPYTVDAYQYPTFASIMPFWAALSLGHWSETLVNTPVLLCGIAMGLALYGQAREVGLGPVPSLASAYFLLSIPLLGTHLSLAGYADIWMAGFTGLGFVSLLRGRIQHNRFELALGILMVAISAAVKNEGMVWLYTAIAFVVLSSASRRLLMTIMALALIFGCLAWLTGMTSVDLPGLGLLGFEAGSIHIPLVGSYPLQYHPVWSAYHTAFLQHDSWNLLWFFVIVAFLASFFSKSARIRKSALIFIGLFAASQLAIFAITEQGAWAQTFTAINRLPLHFAPALVFTIFLILAGIATEQPGDKAAAGHLTTAGYRRAVPAAIAAAVVMLGMVVALVVQPDRAAAFSRVFTKDTLRVVVGSGRISDGALEIAEYKNGAAIVSTGSVALDADQFDMLEVQIYSDSDRTPMFFWRAAGVRGLQMAPLYSEHRHLLLENLPGWSGRITEAGIALFGDETTRAGVTRLSLSPKTLTTSLQSVLDDWATVRPWTPVSINVNSLGPENQQVRLATLALTWLLLALLLAHFLSRGAKPGPPVLATLLIIAWILPDAIWLHNRIGRLENTFRMSAAARDVPHIDIGFDKEIAQLVAAARHDLDRLPTARVLIVAASEKNQYEALRAKYHLLPHAAVVTDTQTAKKSLARADALLYIPDQNHAAGRARDGVNPANLARQAVDPNLTEIVGSSFATLMRTERASGSARPRQDG